MESGHDPLNGDVTKSNQYHHQPRGNRRRGHRGGGSGGARRTSYSHTNRSNHSANSNPNDNTYNSTPHDNRNYGGTAANNRYAPRHQPTLSNNSNSNNNSNSSAPSWRNSESRPNHQQPQPPVQSQPQPSTQIRQQQQPPQLANETLPKDMTAMATSTNTTGKNFSSPPERIFSMPPPPPAFPSPPPSLTSQTAAAPVPAAAAIPTPKPMPAATTTAAAVTSPTSPRRRQSHNSRNGTVRGRKLSSNGQTPPSQQSRGNVGARHKAGTTPSDWSTKVWQGVGYSDRKAYSTGTNGGAGVTHTSTFKVGLGRATGLSRVPDKSLVENPKRIEERLHELAGRVEQLEKYDCSVVSAKPDISVDAAISGETAAIFEAILGGYRDLTMAITALSSSDDPYPHSLSIPVYEAAADAALLGGNLDFYLVCQTRLSELYSSTTDPAHCARKDEFFGYSLLYFGVFINNSMEIARNLRQIKFNRISLSSPHVHYALRAINAFKKQDAFMFIDLYKEGNVRQKTIIHPVLKNIQKLGMRTLVKAYLSVNRKYAIGMLGMTSEEEFLNVMEVLRPDLLPYNKGRTSNDFFFRVPRN